MDERKDIATLGDIQLLVNAFYQQIREDALLGPIFNGVIQDRWPAHLEKMYRFWLNRAAGRTYLFWRPISAACQTTAGTTAFRYLAANVACHG